MLFFTRFKYNFIKAKPTVTKLYAVAIIQATQQWLGPGSMIDGINVPSQDSHNKHHLVLRVNESTLNHISYMF
jgi:hypothetical protein